MPKLRLQKRMTQGRCLCWWVGPACTCERCLTELHLFPRSIQIFARQLEPCRSHRLMRRFRPRTPALLQLFRRMTAAESPAHLKSSKALGGVSSIGDAKNRAGSALMLLYLPYCYSHLVIGSTGAATRVSKPCWLTVRLKKSNRFCAEICLQTRLYYAPLAFLKLPPCWKEKSRKKRQRRSGK